MLVSFNYKDSVVNCPVIQSVFFKSLNSRPLAIRM